MHPGKKRLRLGVPSRPIPLMIRTTLRLVLLAALTVAAPAAEQPKKNKKVFEQGKPAFVPDVNQPQFDEKAVKPDRRTCW